jgi:hypothetical protein
MAKMSLKEWINSKQKAKGLSTKEAKAGASKYKSISAAKKAGSLYYTNKDGKTMIAATAEDLKSSAPAKSLRPKKRPTSGGSRPAETDAETAEVKAANVKIKADEAKRRKAKLIDATASLKSMKTPSSDRGKSFGKRAKKPGPKGAAWMKVHNYADYKKLTKSEARNLGLPATAFASAEHDLRGKKFKDGLGFGGK